MLGLIAVTGSVLAWRIVGSWSALVETAYGRVLLVKIGVVLAVAAIAGANRFWLLPRTTSTEPAASKTARRTVIRTVAAEAALLVAVVGLTGFLVQLSPNVGVDADRTITATKPLGDLTVRAALSPAVHGPNELTVELLDADGSPVDPYAAPTATLNSIGLNLGEIELTRTAVGTYSADVVIPQSGNWVLQVGARTSRFDNPVTLLFLTVS